MIPFSRKVRAAGLGIAASLASCEEGCAAVANCFQQRTGGVWGLGLSVLLDHTECSVVRQQVKSFLFLPSLLSFSLHPVNISAPKPAIILPSLPSNYYGNPWFYP